MFLIAFSVQDSEEFGGNVVRSPNWWNADETPVFTQSYRRAEVSEFQMAETVEENVFWLDIWKIIGFCVILFMIIC